MDKNSIKKYAVWARRELITRVSQRAAIYGITKDEILDAGADSINGIVLSPSEKEERIALIKQIESKGYEEVMEEVAYTWFNRFMALRFMEVNGYLPTRIRVFTDEDNKFNPQILQEAIHLDIDGLDMDKVYALKDANNTDELYKYLIITQCNALHDCLPGMFQKIEDYTELLFPDNILREGSVVEQMISQIPEEDWQDAVQIIGWLYQYYNSEKKDDVFAALKKNVKITKENIPAATQLFTPDWIVRYMVENSLGRLWVEGHPNEELKSQWKYYLEEAEQEPEVQTQLAEIRKEYASLNPEEIKCIDPCCGSGHILAYMFDVLVQIYEAHGYTTRDAVASIVENNIYGLDIDDRAAQLAYFAVMMKACQYDKRFLKRGIQPHVHAIVESNEVDRFAVDYFCNGNASLTKAMNTVIAELNDAKEYGSILTVTDQNWNALYARFDEIENEISMNRESALKLKPLVKVAEVLAQKYEAVVTNPPYMGASGMSATLSDYVKNNYPDSKADLFAVFIEKCPAILKSNGMYAMITQHAFMFLSSFEKLREKMQHNTTINMAHLGARAFDEIGGEVVQTTAFVSRKKHTKDYLGTYARLVDVNGESEKEKLFLSGENRCAAKQENFSKIPGAPVAYWVSDTVGMLFSEKKIGDFYRARVGIQTNNNDLFLKLWFETSCLDVFLEDKINPVMTTKWYPHPKGGSYRKWYGNFDYVVNLQERGRDIQEYSGRPLNLENYFQRGLSWSHTTSGGFSGRLITENCMPNLESPVLYINDGNLQQILGLLNSKVGGFFLKIMNTGLHYHTSNICGVPFIMTNKTAHNEIDELVDRCICIGEADWNLSETSWGFMNHFLV